MDEEQTQNRASSVPTPPSSNHGIVPSSSSTTTSPVSQVSETEETEVNAQQQQEEEEDHPEPTSANRRRNPRTFPQRIGETVSFFRSNEEWSDAWSCLVVLLTFCCFACMATILGFYGSFNLQLGPNSSYLIEASPIFARYIKAEETDGKTAGPMLYGFHSPPSLDVKTTWTQNHNASIAPYLYEEWTYYLNAGSQIDILYDVKFPSSAPLFLAIAQGRDSLLKWVEDPSYPNSTVSWKMIYGTGKLELEVFTSDAYYVAVGNLNSDTTAVALNITVHSLLYDTSDAYFKCSLSNHICSFRLHLFRPNSAILSTPGPENAKADEDWYVEVSFVAQWISYVCGTCIITALMLALFRLCNLYQSNSRDEAAQRATNNGEEHEPLLSPKGDDRWSWGSSYESIPNDEEDLEEKLLEGYPEGGKVSKEGEVNYNPRRLCVVCFDGPRDCFFLPCGHCATCFPCGSRIAEEAGTCPICRRKMKKVRKIFAV